MAPTPPFLPLEADGDRRRSHRRSQALAAAATIGAAVASAVGATVLVAGLSRATLRHEAPIIFNASPLTVRALLESDEVKDVTTDNLLALHGSELASEGRDQLRERVSRGLLHIDGMLEQMDPEAHRKLGELELTDEQKDSAMHRLRKFGDARMVGLSRAISAAVEENARDAGDADSLQHRLSEKLSARMGDLATLNSEMSPKKPVVLDMSRAAPALDSWHPQLEIEFGRAERDSMARRLSVLDGVNGGINAHAQALFESLEGDLGEKMPHAPARMLGMMDMLKKMADPKSDNTYTSNSGGQSLFGGTTSSSTQQDKEQSFMACVAAAVPNPAKFAKCVMDNMSEVMSMVMKFMQGGGSQPHR